MDDSQILLLYWNRDEKAIAQTRAKYGRYLSAIAFNILADREDSEECVSDAYLKAWSAIPEEWPADLRAYLGRIVRNLSLNRYAGRMASKRGGGETALLLGELEDCLPSSDTVEGAMENTAIIAVLNSFLDALGAEQRALFVRRYWYMQSIGDLVELTGYSAGKIKSILFRLRKQLKARLDEGGIAL